MKPPKQFRERVRLSFSQCIACTEWTPNNNYFYHEGREWILCRIDYADYWENTDELLSDFKGYNV